MMMGNTLTNDRVVIPGEVDESPRLFSATYLFMKSASLLVVLFFASSPGFTASASSAANATADITPTPMSPRQRTLKAEDFAALRDVDEPKISPDGNLVAYIVKTADIEKDKLIGNLWLAKWDGSENRALTFGNKDQSHPRWSPDGRWIAFLSSRENENEIDQLWVMSSSGGEAEKFTDLKGNVEDFAWSPDSKRIVLVVQDPDPREPEKKEKEKKTVPPLVIDRFFFKKDIDGYLTDRWAHLQLLDVGSRKINILTSGKHDEFLPAWSPDGNEIAFVTKRGDHPDRSENWDVYIIGAQAGGKERQLTTSPEADPDPYWESAPAWSPDGKWIAYIHGSDPKKIEYGVHTLAIIPATGGEPKILTANLDRNVVEPHWAPDGRSFSSSWKTDGAESLVRVPVNGGAAEPVAAGRRKVTAYDVSKEGRTIVRTSTPDHPYEIFAAEKNNLRNLSKQNDALLAQIKLGRVEETKFKSKDGTEIHGFLIQPADLAAGTTPPALLRLHGGPQSQYANEFDFEKQLFAANGYAVIMPNPRGSTGRGDKFAMGIYANWGHLDVEDDLAAMDDAQLRAAWRMPTGWVSVAGCMAAFPPTISSPALRASKAAASGASTSNALAGYGTDEYIRDYENELGVPWQNLETWTRISYPFLHADRIKTPTLFLCGQNDLNVPLLNTEQMYQSLRKLWRADGAGDLPRPIP